MSDGDTLAGNRVERGLTYPFAAVPVTGEAVSVAPGVLWLRLPLPMALDHINLYAIEDDGGLSLIHI